MADQRTNRNQKLIVVLASLLALACGCTPQKKSKLQAVIDAGELVVLTRNSPTTFYKGSDGYEGIEYDMVTAFADHLGVAAVFQTMKDEKDEKEIKSLEPNEVDLIAAGLGIEESRLQYLYYTQPYQSVTYSVIYRNGTFPPQSVKYLHQHHIDVVANTGNIEHLEQVKKENPQVSWTEVDDKSEEELLQTVNNGLLELTVVDSNIFSLNRPFYPELRKAFDIGKTEQLAWALPRTQDKSLYHAADQFLARLKKNGELERLLDHYYGVTGVSNPVNMTVYHLRIQNRLPKYQTMFEKTGQATGLDWRLLAAISYQESFWNPQATSPTGVRGMMMLTKDTARSLGIKDRTDPMQSIDGGARHIKEILDRLPPAIKEPDRLWLALAAYNVGEGHLEDARIITQKRKGDPNSWDDVKKTLPLLSRQKWYKKTKYGYARGFEPVRFVTRIRNYYEVLVRKNEEEQSSQQTDAIKLKAPAI